MVQHRAAKNKIKALWQNGINREEIMKCFLKRWHWLSSALAAHCYRVLLSKHGIIWHYYTHRHPPLKTWESAYYGTSFSSTTNKHCSFWSVCICWRINCKWKQGISCKDGYVTPVIGVGSWNKIKSPSGSTSYCLGILWADLLLLLQFKEA